MGIKPGTRAQCAALLPGEDIHYLFPVTALAAGRAATRPFLVAVTQRWICLIAVTSIRSRPASVYARYRRDTIMGPLDLTLGPTIRLGPWVLEVADDYAAQVLAADAEIRPPDFPDDGIFGGATS
ncbi:MAG: hypothetical protein QOF57_2447 [Frankiaceae bacterium]|jgi:hypothetical protein|nr:hypothetical protein [Frankiaceae bacterium]